jgi:hypothetical protein
MDVTNEVASIVVMVIVLVASLALLGWAYGDFQRRGGRTGGR